MQAGPNPYLYKVQDALHSGAVPILACGLNQFDQQVRGRFLEIYPNFAKHVFELGCGSGRHLIARASESPETAYFGVDLRFKRIFRAAQKAAALNLKNVFFLQLDAKYLRDLILAAPTPQSAAPNTPITGIYMNFPDPWGKLRWRKNRMYSEAFLNTAADILRPDGWISFTSDHEEYFEDALQKTTAHTQFAIDHSTRGILQYSEDEMKFLSEFGLLFRAKQVPVNTFRAHKIKFTPAE